MLNIALLVKIIIMSKNYKWVNLSPDEIWEQTSPKVYKNKKKYNRKKLKDEKVEEDVRRYR